MPTQTGSLDLRASANAANEATKYITEIDQNGIKVHAENNASQNYAKIDANGMEVFKGGASVAQYGDTARIGKTAANNGNVVTNSDGIDLRVGTTTVGSLKQIRNYDPPDFGEGFTYDNVLQLNAIQFFQLISDSDIVMEAGTKYVTSIDTDSPDYDPDASADEQPTVTTNEGTQINFRVPNGWLGLGGKDNETPNNAVYSGDLVNLWETVTNPTGNPEQEGWYERFYPYEGDDQYYRYQKTSDTTVDSTKTYYSQTSQAFGIGATVFDPETTKEYGWVGLQINNYDGDGLTRGVYDGTLPYSEWMIGRNEDGTMKLFGKPLADYVVSEDEQAVSYGNQSGYWRWREWHSGKVEAWYSGGMTLNQTASNAGGLYRYLRRVSIPNNYALYNCMCIVNGTAGGGWLNCGGLFDSSDVHAEPYTRLEVMAYQINARPSAEQTNVNIYVCGEKSLDY